MSKPSDYFEYKNVNPKGIRTGDCVVRAIALAMDTDWYTVYDKLTEVARDEACIMDDDICHFRLLNAIAEPVRFPKGQHKGRVWQFIDKHRNDEFVYVVQVRGHLTCIIDDKIMDTWNCCNRVVCKAWRFPRLKSTGNLISCVI